MHKLIPLFICCMILAYIIDINSYNGKQHEEYLIREKIFYVFMIIILVLFAGLRTRYNDTGGYIDSYNNIVLSENFIREISWNIGDNPGFNLVNYILKYLGFSSQSFVMFYSAITIIIYMWFIKKYSEDFKLSIYLFFTAGVYIFTFAAIKQCVAVAICLLAVDKFVSKKWIEFIVLIFIACTFHTYALMYLILPCILYAPWSINTYLMFGACIVCGFSLQQLLNSILNITTMLGENYDPTVFNGEGVNVFRLAVSWAPILLGFLARREMKKSDNVKNNIMFNFMMLNAEIMFIARFGTANYFARLANYFLIFQIIAIPYILKYFTVKSQKLLKIIVVLGYGLYFYYQYVVSKSFDEIFESVTLMEYLRSICFKL